jgi:hypothetical protein
MHRALLTLVVFALTPWQAGPAWGQLSAADPNTHTSPADANASEPEPAAVVGGQVVPKATLERIAARIPPAIPAMQADEIKRAILDRLIATELINRYLADKDIPCTQAEVTAYRAGLREGLGDQMPLEVYLISRGLCDRALRAEIRLQKHLARTISDRHVDALLEAHPEYVDGTVVQARHILIKCGLHESTDRQKLALQRIGKLREALVSGRADFDKLAREYSQCQSSLVGGKLSPFTLDEMVPAFAVAALDATPGEVTPVVRTELGFHLILVERTVEGEGKVDESTAMLARDTARRVLENRTRLRVAAQALAGCPVEVRRTGWQLD